MPVSLERRLSKLIQDINEIKKELIIQKIRKTKVKKGGILKWRELIEKVTERWDDVSAIEEIKLQREKTY